MLSILFEDEDMIVLNKPAGLLSTIISSSSNNIDNM